MATDTINTYELLGAGEPQTGAEVFGQTPIDDDSFSGSLPSGDSAVLETTVQEMSKPLRDVYVQDGAWDAGARASDIKVAKEASPSQEAYDTEGKKSVNSLFFAQQLQIDPAVAYESHDDIARQFFDADDTPDGYFARIQARYQNGVKSVQASDEGYKILVDVLDGNITPDIEKRMKDVLRIQSGISRDGDKDLRAWHEKMLGATSEQLPIFFKGAKGGFKGSLLGGATGAGSALALGVLIPAPEEVLTVPAGALYGMKTGAAIGAGIAIGKMEAGNNFVSLMQTKDEFGNTVDPKLAAITASAVGAINGGIEIAEWAFLLSTFGIGTKVFENAAQRVTSKLLTEGTLIQVLAKHLVKFGATLTAETAQELLQESTSVVGEELAKEINNSRKGTDFEPITGEALADRMMETAIESARAFPLLLAPGTAISTGIDINTVKQQRAAAFPDIPVKGEQEAKVVEPETVEGEAKAPTTLEEIPFKESEIKSLSELDIETAKEVRSKPEAGAKVDAIVNRPADVSEDGGSETEELTPEESNALKRLNAEVEAENLEEVTPNLYIGNVTQRQKKVFAEEFGVKPEDVSGFTEGAFPTKRTGVPMTRGEATELLSTIEASLDERLEGNKIATENDLATANADWGDIKALRETLGLPKVPRPFRVTRAGKNKVITIENVRERIKAAIQPGTLDASNMTIGQVLNVTLKRVAQAARHAFSVGKKEGIARTKEHFAEVKAREKVRKALKTRIDKALKTINKPTSKNVDVYYRKAIDSIRKEIDPKKRTKKTNQRRARQKAFLGKATKEQVADFPQSLFDSLVATPLNDITISEIEEVAKTITALERIGKTKKRVRDNAAKLARQNNIAKAIKTMSNGKKADFSADEEFIDAATSPTDLIKTVFVYTLTTPRLLDWIDGAKGTFDGLMHDIFYNRVNTQYNQEMESVKVRHSSMREISDSLGITDDELTEVVDLNGHKPGLQLYKEQIMGIYAAMLNRKSREAMLATLKISEGTANAIVSNLDQKFIDMADAVIEDYAANYSSLEAAHLDFTNEILGVERFYTPIVRIEKDGIVAENDIVDQLLARDGFRRIQTDKGFTVERQTIAPENQKKMDLRLVSIWRSQTQKQEHYISFASLIKDLNGYMSDKKFTRAINSVLGPQGAKTLKDYVDRVANPNVYKSYGTIENMSRKLRGNMAMAYLSYNLLTVLKQAPSMVLALREAGADSLLSSIGQYATNPKGFVDKVEAKFPQLKEGLDREFNELRDANTKGWQKLINTYGQKGLEGIKFVDTIIKSIVFDAVYEKEMSSKGSEVKARQMAENTVLRTQPTASAKELAALYTKSEVLNWMLVFTNQLNKIWNITTYDTFAQWNNKNYQGVAANLLAVAINASVIWMVTNKRLPEDEEDLLEMATDQLINMVPVVGKDIMAGKKGWGGSEVAPFNSVKQLASSISTGDQEKIAKEFLEQAAVAVGVPVVAIKRGSEFLETGDFIELVGGER
jgi:hypothetical protein